LQVAEIQRNGADPHQRLSRSGDRGLAIKPPQVFNAEFMVENE
jgi:hypothetical protein